MMVSIMRESMEKIKLVVGLRMRNMISYVTECIKCA